MGKKGTPPPAFSQRERQELEPLLKQIGRLRVAYAQSAGEGNRAAIVNKIVSLLQGPKVSAILNDLLADQRGRGYGMQRYDKDEIERLTGIERDLAKDFGFSEKECSSFIQQAIRDDRSLDPIRIIFSTESLVLELQQLEANFGSEWNTIDDAFLLKRSGLRKRLLKKVDATLFSLGVIIGDGCSSPSFPFSYSVGLATLGSAA